MHTLFVVDIKHFRYRLVLKLKRDHFTSEHSIYISMELSNVNLTENTYLDVIVNPVEYQYEVRMGDPQWQNTQGNLITGGHWNRYYCSIYLCSQKYKRKIEHNKTLPKWFSLMVTFYIDRGAEFRLFSYRKFCCWWQFFCSQQTLLKSFLLHPLKNCVSIFIYFCINICFA